MLCFKYFFQKQKIKSKLKIYAFLLVICLLPISVSAFFYPPFSRELIFSKFKNSHFTLHRKVENRAFGVGEKLVYEVSWMGLSSGEATLEVADIIKKDGYEAYQIISEANSNSFIDGIYKVRNHYETYLDTQLLCSRRFIERQREASHQKDRISEYYQELGMALINDDPKTDTLEGKFLAIPTYVQDVLSVLYYFRTLPIKIGQTRQIVTNSGTHNYSLEVEVKRKEKITTAVGTFDTYLVIPHLKYGGIFKSKGNLYMWITDDERRIPVLMKSNLIIGPITASLIEYRSF